MGSVRPMKVLIKSSHENLNVINHRREGKVSKYPNRTMKFIRLNLARFSFFEMRFSYKKKKKLWDCYNCMQLTTKKTLHFEKNL